MVLPARGLEIFDLNTGYRCTIGGSMTQTADGRLLLVTCGPEPFIKDAFGVYRTEVWESRDCGRSWEQVYRLHEGGKDVVFLPGSIMRLASGKLLLMECLYGGYDGKTHDPERSLLELYTQTSDDDGRTWGEPHKVETTWRYVSVPLAFIQLSSGRLLYPSGYLTERSGSSVICSLYSDDEGDTWQRSPDVLDIGGEGFESGPCEPTVVELPDGRVWMLMRTQTGVQWESFSSDGGVSWTAPQPGRFPSSSAPATFCKLRDGRIVVVWNNAVFAPYARTSLAIAMSDDGGQTFYGFREIDHTPAFVQNFEQRYGVQYAFPAEAPDGTIVVPYNVGDWSQMHLRIARIDPAWVAERTLDEEFADGLGAWCGVGAKGISITSMGDAQGNADPCFTGSANLEALNREPAPKIALHVDWMDPGPCGMTRNFPLLTNGTVTCDMTVYGPSALLLHHTFPEPGKVEEACLRVRFDEKGNAFVGAGTPTPRTIRPAQWAPEYGYTAMMVQDEVAYPRVVPMGTHFSLTARIDNPAGKAWVKIADGPEVELLLPDISGLCYFNIAALPGGGIRLHRLQSH